MLFLHFPRYLTLSLLFPTPLGHETIIFEPVPYEAHHPPHTHTIQNIIIQNIKALFSENIFYIHFLKFVLILLANK
jgi:hypothetical protein